MKTDAAAAYGQLPALFSPRPESAHEAQQGHCRDMDGSVMSDNAPRIARTAPAPNGSYERVSLKHIPAGTRFGRWTALEVFRGPAGGLLVRVRCDCGTEKALTKNALRGSRACGCVKKIVESRLNWKHGMWNTPAWRSWNDMMLRCHQPKNKEWRNYGGRGISVCDRWREFKNFVADMGPRPEGRTLDRIDNNGNYEPGNCRWATALEQGNNTRKCRFLEHNGERLTVSQWARKLGICRSSLARRLEHGWSLERALTTPSQGYKQQTETRMGEVIGQGVAHTPAELVLPTQDLSYADQSEAA